MKTSKPKIKVAEIRSEKETDTEYVFPALVLPYGGHKAGNVDCHNQRFTEKTDFKTEALPFPPIVYAHGYAIDAEGVADRVVVGRTVDRWYDSEGGWALVGITKSGPLAAEVMSSYRNGTLKFSSGALLASLNKVDGQTYDVWLAGEFSVVTDQAPVQACNLLARAGQYGKMAMDDIRSTLSEEQRAAIDQLISESEVANSNNPAGAEGDRGDLEDFADGETEDGMKPEELTAAMGAALEPLNARLTALEAAPKPAATAPLDDPAKQKMGDIDPALASLIDATAERHKTDAGVGVYAAKLVDGYIAAGKVAPTERLGLVVLASAAINADGRKKTDNGAVAAFISSIEGRQPMAVQPGEKLAGFGAANPASADAADVASMFKTVQAE